MSNKESLRKLLTIILIVLVFIMGVSSLVVYLKTDDVSIFNHFIVMLCVSIVLWLTVLRTKKYE